MFRRIIHNLLLFLAFLVAGLLIMEWGVRALAPQALVRGYNIPDPELGTYMAPSVHYTDPYSFEGPYEVRTNAMGFRMDEEVSTSPDRLRVMVYGDSFTFGWGLDIQDTYFRALKTIAETANPRLQLLNAAVGGYGTGHVKKLMARHIPAIEPAAIVYFFNNNDLLDNAIEDIDYQVTKLTFSETGEARLVDVKPFAPWKRFLITYTPYGWLNRRSHLFVLVKDQLKKILNWKRYLVRPKVSTVPLPAKPKIAEPAFTLKLPRESQTREALNRLVYLSELHVQRIAHIAHAAGVPMLLIWVPAPSEMFPPKKPTAEIRLLEKGRAMLRGLASQMEGIDFIDVVSKIDHDQAWRDRQSTLRLSDGHFNAAGSAWYAALVREPLLDFLKTVGTGSAVTK